MYVPSLELGLPQPLSRKRVGGGGTLACGSGGLGESQFQRQEKELSTLPTLWGGEELNHTSARKPGPL